MINTLNLALAELINRRSELGVRNPMHGACFSWQKTTRYLVFTLCAGFKALQFMRNTIVYALIKTGFKMQAVIFLFAPPKTAK